MITAIATLITAIVGAAALFLTNDGTTTTVTSVHETFTPTSATPSGGGQPTSHTPPPEPVDDVVTLKEWTRAADGICKEYAGEIQRTYVALTDDADQGIFDSETSAHMADVIKADLTELSGLTLPDDASDQVRATDARQKLLTAWQNLTQYADQGGAAVDHGDFDEANRLWGAWVDPFNGSQSALAGMGASHCVG
jgi:hypothetical protein